MTCFCVACMSTPHQYGLGCVWLRLAISVDDHCFGGTPNWSARVDCWVYIVGRSAPEVCVSVDISYISEDSTIPWQKGVRCEYSIQFCFCNLQVFQEILRYWKSASFQLERRRSSFHLEKVWLSQSCVGTDWTISHIDLSWEPKSYRLRDAIWST